jgi:hypothetical protein
MKYDCVTLIHHSGYMGFQHNARTLCSCRIVYVRPITTTTGDATTSSGALQIETKENLTYYILVHTL